MLGRLFDRPPVEAADQRSVGGGSGSELSGPLGSASAGGTTRRAIISRGLWAAAGAVGLGVASTGVTLGTTQARVAPAGPTRLSLVVRDVRFAAAGAKPGTLREAGAAVSPHGALHDAAGQQLGRFSGGTLPGSDGQIAVQRFTFADGTIIGMGSGGLDGEEYAVVGGTGRYAGAVGTYVAQIRPGAHGRDADFQINITGTRG